MAAEAKSAKELLEQFAAEQHFARLADEIHRLVDGVGIPEALREQLPPLLLTNEDEDTTIALPPTGELVVAAQVFKAILAVHRKNGQQLDEFLEIINQQLVAKEKEIMAVIDDNLRLTIAASTPAFGDDVEEIWARLAEIVAEARVTLTRMLRASRRAR